MNALVLNKSVPEPIHQIFDTARNLSLYGFYATHFHQAAMLYSFIALESALKIKAEKEEPIWYEENNRGYGPNFYKTLDLAKHKNWLVNEKFSFFYNLACHNAQMKKLFEIDEGIIPEPTKQEIDEEIKITDIVSGIISYSNKLRNSIAHGSAIMDPTGSHGCLRKNCEAINQLFPDENDPSGAAHHLPYT